MTRRMLINAQNPEELRIAIVSDSNLESFQTEVSERGLARGNIYRGIISSIQPSLNAAFIDYGAERNGFLAIQDVVPEAYYRQPGQGRPRIEEVLERGKPIVVQVVKEAEGQKGAALTTNLSLAGRYLVLTPFDDTRGISRKVEDEEVRRELKDLAARLEVPPGCGFIIRTNALDQNKTALARDLAALLRIWKRVQGEARRGGGVRLLYSDQDLILKALRDYLDNAISEVLIDDDQAFEKAAEYMRAFMPRSKTRLVRYTDRAPLFSRYQIEPQIGRIYERSVGLPSGGSIVIDRTEALTAIDVNSGRSTKAASQEDTALATNLEAAREVARQLRLRDLGGLIVVDFIDMRSVKSQRKVEKAMRDAMKDDKARSTVGRISPNGLLEINRQKIQQALSVRTHRSCPTCAGTGRIASPEMVGLNLLRQIEARAATGPLKRVRISLHPELADAFQNGRRHEIVALEDEFDIDVEVIASNRLHRPEQEVEWINRAPGEERRVRQPKVEKPAVQASALAEWTPADDADEDDLEDEEGEEPDEDGDDAAEAAAHGERKGDKRARKRRRRGKRKGRDGQERAAHAEHAPHGAVEHPEGAGEPPEAAPADERQAEGPAEGGRGKKRRRRRSRRKGNGEGHAPGPTGGSEPAGEGPAPALSPEATPPEPAPRTEPPPLPGPAE